MVNVTFTAGLVAMTAKMSPAFDKESSGFRAVCTGAEGKKHPPAKVTTEARCTSCNLTHSSVFGFTERAREEGDKLVLVTRDELAEAAGTPRTKNVDLAFHPREKVYAATVAFDSVQNLSPVKGSEKQYVALRDALMRNPGVVACTIWAPSTKNALWVLEVVDRRIVASKRCWPEDVRAVVATPEVEVSDGEAAMFDMLLATLVTDFDVSVYSDEARRNVAELVESKTGVAPAVPALVPTAAAPGGDLKAALQASLDAVTKTGPKRRTPAKKAVAKKVAKKAPARRPARKSA